MGLCTSSPIPPDDTTEQAFAFEIAQLEKQNKKLSKVVKVLRKEIGERDSELDQLLNDHEVLKTMLAEMRHSLRHA